jgi:hypothetical protein
MLYQRAIKRHGSAEAASKCESGHVIKPSNGWYSKVNTLTGEIEEKKWRIKDTDTKEFWLPVLMDKTFQDWVQSNYQIANGSIIKDEDIDAELAAIEDIVDED